MANAPSQANVAASAAAAGAGDLFLAKAGLMASAVKRASRDKRMIMGSSSIAAICISGGASTMGDSRMNTA